MAHLPRTSTLQLCSTFQRSAEPESAFAEAQNLRATKVAWTIGSTFFVINSFLVLKAAIKAKDFPLLNCLVTLLFHPSLQGPSTAPSSGK